MKRNRDDCRNLAAPEEIRNRQAQERLDPEQWRESDKHPDRHPASHRMRRIPQVHQPVAQIFEICYQTFHWRTVSAIRASGASAFLDFPIREAVAIHFVLECLLADTSLPASE